MVIIDTCFRLETGIDIWHREGSIRCERIPVQPQFYLNLPDPHAHADLISALEDRYAVEECIFSTIFGTLPGFRITAGREVAEAIEQQSRYSARIYNADIRLDQKYLAEHGMFPCRAQNSSRFDPACACDLRQAEIAIPGMPSHGAGKATASVPGETPEPFCGSERDILADLFAWVNTVDPDVILFPNADAWIPHLIDAAKEYGLDPPFSRSRKFRRLDSRSYWSYGRVEHRKGARLPDGRILIDTEQSFVYREGGLAGVILASRLTGLSPNLAARFTPGTLISGYEVYEALSRGIAVPLRKSDPEQIRSLATVRSADRGGMMFQPVAGCYGPVCQIDFTSLYPSIIVNENLSPETIGHPERIGFLSGVLEPLLDLRITTKRLKKQDNRYAGIDAVLKWMLVTCFGYTGYKNAKFGRIEVHEAITARSREILLQTKQIAESMGFVVVHGIVDCLWVKGTDTGALVHRVEQSTGLFIEPEYYDWIVFLPLADGFGAYNRYYGRLTDGSIKVRGIAARRHDTPAYVRQMQQEMLTCMTPARTCGELAGKKDAVRDIYRKYCSGLLSAPPDELVIHKRISRLTYAHRCLEGAAVTAYSHEGIAISPGMKIGYVVRDARNYIVDTEGSATTIDLAYYRQLLETAGDEIVYAFRSCPAGMPVPGEYQICS